MKISGVTYWRPEVRIGVEIEDGPVLPMAYSRAGGRYRVDAVSVMWSMDQHGQWDAQFVTLSGPRIKKDGTDSLNRYECPLMSYDLRDLKDGKATAVERWGWLLPVLGVLRPQGPPPAGPTREALDTASTDQEDRG